MDWNEVLKGLLTALGVGLLIGVVRERHYGPNVSKAGVRTHALVALLGAVAMGMGMPAFVTLLLIVGAYAIAGYWNSHRDDPGLTGEVALLVSAMLGALAQQEPALAAGLGVVAAILLQAKRPLQRFTRELISEREMQDALLLAAAALVVMPLLPDRPLDPWGVLPPRLLWKIVVLVMAVGMLGHIALRAVGARWGLPVAGFFSGFASSTAAVAGFGRRAADNPALVAPAGAAALLANLASLLLFVAVIGTVAPPLLAATAWPLTAAALGLLAFAALGLHRANHLDGLPAEPEPRAFHLTHALLIAAIIAVVLLLSAWLRQVFGDAGALVAATLVALAEIHAAAASIAQLTSAGGLPIEHARWGVVALLAAGSLAKLVLALVSGGWHYGRYVGAGLLAMTGAAAVVTALAPY